eukprot:11002370-Lingulodinium_polyedra.AAC.1
MYWYTDLAISVLPVRSSKTPFGRDRNRCNIFTASRPARASSPLPASAAMAAQRSGSRRRARG